MKTQEQDKARNLYLQTNLSKTEIAEKLGVNRRTIYQWSVDGDWDILRTTARNMPTILAQKIYHVIGHLTDKILTRDVAYETITKDEVNMLAKLVTTVNKVKIGSTAGENMETFTYFLEGLKVKDPFLAEELLPHVDDFVTAKATQAQSTFVLDGYNKDGSKPYPEKELLEKWQDEKDYDAIVAENNNQPQPPERTYTSPAPSAQQLHHEMLAQKTIHYKNGIQVYPKLPCHPEFTEGHPEPVEGQEPVESGVLSNAI
ncbi:MAG: DUF1804 family protein [Taibaiella sp.]|nr:DUF1804 family protein [Taibaiella sp.]